MAEKKKKSPDKPSSWLLGTGMARSAADKAQAHNRKICEASGGRYNAKKGSCN